MIRRLGRLAIDLRAILSWLLATASVSVLLAVVLVPRSTMAAEQAAGVLLYQQVDANTFRYNVDLHDSGTTNIGTLWYAWIPHADFLTASPTNLRAPAGWTAVVTHLGPSDGFAVQWFNAGSPLTAGQTFDGFGFDSQATPAQLNSAQISPTFIYSAAPSSPGTIPSSDAGVQFDIVPPADPWQNPFLPLDVNHDGRIEAIDVLNVVNSLNSFGSGALGVPTLSDAPPFLDVNGDGSVAAIDALQIVNHLNSIPPSAAAALSSPATLRSPVSLALVATVPEPNGGVLAALGLLGLLACSRRQSQPRGVN